MTIIESNKGDAASYDIDQLHETAKAHEFKVSTRKEAKKEDEKIKAKGIALSSQVENDDDMGFDIDSKNENENENENVEEKEDRISQLSDDVISSIISRLATVDAVRTSVLSRRWRHIYTHINRVKISCTDLCFPRLERTLQSQRKFVERVDTFLKHHSGSKIMSFELVCYFCGSISDKFKELMNSLGTLGVEQFTLGFCSNRYQSPVFSTDLLHGVKYLRLKGGSFLTPNKNALRVLELDRISFTSEAVQSLLSNCTSLQSMILRFCELPTKLLIHGPHLQLKSLTIFHCIYVVEIELSANNLTHFDICDLLGIVKLSFSHVPLLKTLALRFYGSEIVPYVFEKTAEDLPHLESMVFRTSASLFEGCKLDRVISKLINLGHLVLILEGHHHKLDLLELDVFLYSCPLLHKFQLSMEGKWTFNLKKALKRMVRRDNQLKEVEFNGLSEKNLYFAYRTLLREGIDPMHL
ncbi:F-box/FBD/LRR-repeat protein At5g44980-like [Henckelia pumila]|uniref:F-box/FBD/LRR-repeat protein At5g44980-like n=1 Tax=Henckelia pumila TaxID=405737 RepID=UPI003C6DDEE0